MLTLRGNPKYPTQSTGLVAHPDFGEIVLVDLNYVGEQFNEGVGP